MPDPAVEHASVVEVARSLAPRIEAAAEEIEAGRLPLVRVIAETGLFRIMVPRALGGDEVDPLTVFRVVEEVSRVGGSAGWVVMVGVEAGAASRF